MPRSEKTYLWSKKDESSSSYFPTPISGGSSMAQSGWSCGQLWGWGWVATEAEGLVVSPCHAQCIPCVIIPAPQHCSEGCVWTLDTWGYS